jgi:hypothetical protein
MADDQGCARFVFEHANALLELRVKLGEELPQENQDVIAMGKLVPPGILIATAIERDSRGRNPGHPGA